MGYVSHPVRRLRDDPQEGESVSLLVRSGDGDADALAQQLSEFGSVERRLRFGTVQIRVAHPAVDAICALEGIESVETVNTLAIDADGAGEDVDPVR